MDENAAKNSMVDYPSHLMVDQATLRIELKMGFSMFSSPSKMHPEDEQLESLKDETHLNIKAA